MVEHPTPDALEDIGRLRVRFTFGSFIFLPYLYVIGFSIRHQVHHTLYANIPDFGLIWATLGDFMPKSGQNRALAALQGSAWPGALSPWQSDPLPAIRVCQAQQQV